MSGGGRVRYSAVTHSVQAWAADWCSGGMAQESRDVSQGKRTWWFRGRSVNAYGHTPPRMGAPRQPYTTPHTISEGATRTHGGARYQINRESSNTKMVRGQAM